MEFVGIMEKRILNNVKQNLDGLVLDKIVNQYLYPKLPYLNDIVEISKYYKIIHFVDCYNYYTMNKARIIDTINDETSNCNYGTCDYFNIFRERFMDVKDCVINVKKTFKYNNFETLWLLKNDVNENMNLITYLINKKDDISSFFMIDSGIMIRGYKKLLTDIYDFYIIQRTAFISQKDYIYILEDLEYMLDQYLFENNMKNVYNHEYNQKLEIFMKL